MRARWINSAIICFRQIENVGDKSLLIHAVGAGGIISSGDDTAVFGDPSRRTGASGTVALHAARENPKVRAQVFPKIHRTACDDSAVCADIQGSRAHWITSLQLLLRCS